MVFDGLESRGRRIPKYGEKIKIETWVRRQKSSSAMLRDYLMYTENGALAARATSKWALFDMNASRPIRISEELLDRYGAETEKSSFADTSLVRMREAEAYQLEKAVPLRLSDIDVNIHLHNLNYLDLALEALPEIAKGREKISRLAISYRTPVAYGESVCVRVANIDTELTKYSVGIYANDTLRALIELK